VAKALFLAKAEDGTPVAQPLLATLITLLSFFTVLTGLWNKPLEAWAHAAPTSLGISADSKP
jgi:hypothetical protein